MWETDIQSRISSKVNILLFSSQINLILKLFSDLSATNSVHHKGCEADYVKIKVDVIPVTDVNNQDVHKPNNKYSK